LPGNRLEKRSLAVNRTLKEELVMNKSLEGKKVAILVADGFEQSEMTGPWEALEEAGADVDIISPARGEVKGWLHDKWGKSFPVDVPLSEAKPERYDAVVLPGGVMNPDKLRRDETALKFVRSFFDAGKPVGAICHGPWTLIDAGIVKGRRMTSYHTIQSDLKNAGAQWIDKEVVTDNGLVTSRKPDDIPAFCDKLIEEIAEGKHAPQAEVAEVR
jgi:protease I